jgi:RHS repeat-associated protein
MKENKSQDRAIKARNGKYYFYIRDHLGNNRIVADQSGNEEQSTQYYPFGMVLLETNREKQPFKFGGKELDIMNGLNLYDFVWRGYDPATGRFGQIDPLATKYYSISPYAYCNNNPLKYIDPTGMDWFTDTDGTYQFNPELNKDNQAEKLQEGQVYLGVTHQVKNKKGNVIEDYRMDGSIMFSNESSGYARIWNNSLKTGNEEMGIITDNGVLVVPNYKNSVGGVSLDDYGYSTKNGNVVDKNGTEYNTVATVHTHPSGGEPSLYVLTSGGGWGDLGFAASKTPNKPVFVLQNDGKNTVSLVMSAPLNGRLVENFSQYTSQNITAGMPSVNAISIQKGVSLRQFTRKYSNYLRTFYNK